VTSFSKVRAWSGVFVRVSRTQQVSRAVASNADRPGGGAVRFQYVYRLRR
jgi:hypothetical protein